MTALDFPVAGLTNAQWENIRQLATSLRPGQALWVSGFFAGLDHQARALLSEVGAGQTAAQAIGDAGGAAVRSLTILYGSETGKSAALGRSLAENFERRGRKASLFDMASYPSRQLRDEQDLLVIVSTHGEGDPPQSAKAFFEFIEGRRAPRLEAVRFAVLALGDSTYEKYCGAGKRIDDRLAGLGATRIGERVDCDVDYEVAAAAWGKTIVDDLSAAGSGATDGRRQSLEAASAAKAVSHDRKNPASAVVLDNIVLTGRGSSKETRHIELAIEESELSFQPGDALGIIARNDPAVVDAIMESLSLSADTRIDVKGTSVAFREALATAFEITTATPRFIEHWAKISQSDELRAFTGEGQANLWNGFLRENHITDILARYPVKGIDAASFVAGLRPLLPRLYSIASSQALIPDEVHLTVGTVRYELHGRARRGVASGHLAVNAPPETVIPVYVQPNDHFRLPTDDAPIIMIGAGTGIAPYRAFLQEREAQDALGKAWLFFGERNFHSDFLYQTEWQSWLERGTLERMSVAFSRDQIDKCYVQHRLTEQARDVYDWLQNGAHIYVCGDSANLAPGVHAALVAIFRDIGGRSEEQAREDLSQLQSNHRYHIDVY